MKVTASLGLSKRRWCSRHGVELSEGTAVCIHGYTCNTGASVAPLLLPGAFQGAPGEEQEKSVAVKAPKQVHYLNLFIFIPLWELNWFQAKRTAFQGDRAYRAPTAGQLRMAKYCLTILSRAAKMQDGALQNVVTVSRVQRQGFKVADCKKA